jgi:hypothetical protein
VRTAFKVGSHDENLRISLVQNFVPGYGMILRGMAPQITSVFASFASRLFTILLHRASPPRLFFLRTCHLGPLHAPMFGLGDA